MAIKPFKDLSIVDDFMFSEVMRQPENVKPFLEALLGKSIAEVVYIDKQKDLKDEYDAHGIRLRFGEAGTILSEWHRPALFGNQRGL